MQGKHLTQKERSALTGRASRLRRSGALHDVATDVKLAHLPM
ncbi:hypothetical protein ACZ87_02744 [Candidatus Erwinia dacicola]|uniref:Uncharacterized protein n=1 Tax=Candidatus Erwinia dacicola TaxID=252393 RepID=A0A328TMZ0_9GAMM|nr:hypothetical protein ACZ87_02744 [Candidatus Erwinia dacicola]